MISLSDGETIRPPVRLSGGASSCIFAPNLLTLRVYPFMPTFLPRLQRIALAPALLMASFVASPIPAAKAAEAAANPALVSPILQDLRSFNTVATVLHVAAHPDDERTQLITYLARGRGYRTAYLSITRGDGGQNEIGPEFDEKLGVARTQELLAARRLDGGRQFFTRAIDFGYSKTPEETLRFWDRKEVLGDVVRVIRFFRPDVIVTAFQPTQTNTHGHHTSSAILAVEAFKLAGDPAAYPEQLAQGLTVWQPKRIVVNGGGPGGRGGGGAATPGGLQMDIGGNDPVTGDSFASISGRSRAQHITQGFGNLAGGGGGGRGGGGGPSPQSFTLLDGAPGSGDLMDGVDTSWNRVAGGAEIGRLTGEALAQFKAADPAASVPALLAIRAKLADVAKGDPVIDDKRAQLDHILATCLGLTVKTTADRAEVVPGEKLNLEFSATLKANVPVTWLETRAVYPAASSKTGRALKAGEDATGSLVLNVPANAPLTQPYWLREEGSSGIFRVTDPKLIGTPENTATFPVEYVFEVGGQRLVVADEPMSLAKSSKNPATMRARRVDVIPPVALRFVSDVSLFKPGATKAVVVDVVASRQNTTGTLHLALPKEWQVTPASQSFKLATVGEKTSLAFNVTAPKTAVTGRMRAEAEVGGQRYSNQRIEIDYPHFPLQLLQPAATARLVSVEFEARGKRVGYLPGAGDDTAEALENLGYEVRTLSGADLTPEKLKDLDAVVVGVRAFNERTDFAASVDGLYAYVEAGGTVISQYNRPNGLAVQKLGPYQLSIQGSAPALRVTDEKATVSFLAPEDPAVNVPNKITSADFDGWVQERGTYFPSSWDTKTYTPLLAMSDPGEAPLKSSVLIAHHGKGYYVYTGLAFFRQLPAGVPGAYRLFANLVSLGK